MIKKNKTLASIDGWTLEEMAPYVTHTGYETKHTAYMSFIKHACFPQGRLNGVPCNAVHQVVCYPEDTDKCWRCQETIPDMMVVLWNFQNWEKIQQRRGS